MTVLPSADAARAAALVLSLYFPRDGGGEKDRPSFEARLDRVEASGPLVIPANIKPDLVDAAVREAIGASFLFAAINKQPKP